MRNAWPDINSDVQLAHHILVLFRCGIACHWATVGTYSNAALSISWTSVGPVQGTKQVATSAHAYMHAYTGHMHVCIYIYMYMHTHTCPVCLRVQSLRARLETMQHQNLSGVILRKAGWGHLPTNSNPAASDGSTRRSEDLSPADWGFIPSGVCMPSEGARNFGLEMIILWS